VADTLQDEAPPYDLEFLTIEIPESPAPEEMFCAQPRDRFVDQARAICLAPAHASFPGDQPVTISLVLGGSALRASADGWVWDAEGRMPLNDALIDEWSVFGWDVFADTRTQLQQAAQQTGIDQQLAQTIESVRTLIDVSEAALAGQVAEFLLTFEANMLATLGNALEKAPEQAEQIRRRYLAAPAPTSGPTDLQKLHEDLKKLFGVREALLEHERYFAKVFAPVTLAGQVVRHILFPWRIESLLPPPPADASFKTFGPVLGPIIEQWYAEEIRDYETGRDKLLRTSALYYSDARERHPIIQHVWSQFDGDPGEEELGRKIASICRDVTTDSQKALEKLRSDQGYRLLHQNVTVTKTVGFTQVYGPPDGPVDVDVKERRKGTVAEHLAIREAKAPEATLAGLIAGHESVIQRLFGELEGVVNKVSVWDLDALRATTLAEMGEQIGPVERAALDTLDGEIFWKSLATTAKDFAARRALDFALGPVLGVAADALLGLIDGIYDYVTYRDKLLLGNSELLAQSPAARRILSCDPSLVPIFLDAIGFLGDATAIAKWPRLAHALRQTHTAILTLDAGPELVKALAQLAIALVEREDKEEREKEQRNR
jgi:hypothetical protein